MADKAFPSTNDLGGGKTITEENLRDFLAGIMAASGAFVVSGFVVPASSVNLSITIPLGVCYVDGYRIEADAESITVSASNTHYVYLQYAIDGGSNITSHGLTSNTTGVTPARAILLCTLVAGGSAITSTTDRRRVGFNVLQGYQPQAITNASVSVSSVALVNVINVVEPGQLIAIMFDRFPASGATCDLKIEIDGAAAFTETILSGGAFTGILMGYFTQYPDPSSTTSGRRLPLNLYYRQSLKIDIDVTTLGSGSMNVYVLRAKGLN